MTYSENRKNIFWEVTFSGVERLIQAEHGAAVSMAAPKNFEGRN